VDYSAKGMKGTIYEACYDEEHEQTTVDNLNLLYVAFTRASESLSVFGRRGSKSSRSALLEQVLPRLQLEGSVLSGLENPKATLHFCYGDPTVAHTPAAAGAPEKPSANPFLQKSEPVEVQVSVHEPKVFLGQSNQSALFASGTDDDAAEAGSYVQLGSVLHNVFSTIRTTADVDQALLLLEQEGIIYDGSITPQRLQTLIRRRLSDPRVAEWFSDRWTVYNECTILLPEGGALRPDRVMTDGRETIVVDFKFARERDDYHRQVREYMSLLKQMGLPGVKGYLWFVYSNKIVPVSDA